METWSFFFKIITWLKELSIKDLEKHQEAINLVGWVGIDLRPFSSYVKFLLGLILNEKYFLGFQNYMPAQFP